MKRRAFFGFLTGAAAAGPTLTKSLAEQAVSGGLIATPPYASLAQAGIPSSGDWKVNRIAELKKIISGKDPDAKQRETVARLYAAENVERFRLDALFAAIMTDEDSGK